MTKIKVLIVDDSALVRQMISRMLVEDSEIEVVGTAMDPIFAIQKIMRNPPDVITLDVEMPRMDGLTFLEKLMKSYPTPVVMISSHTKKGCEITLRALELGAVDFVAKPEHNTLTNLETLKDEIIAKVKNAARANLKAVINPSVQSLEASAFKDKGDAVLKTEQPLAGRVQHRICAIGASTGGVAAIRVVIDALKPGNYSVLITLHMPPGFTKSFAERLGSLNGWQSSEANDGQAIVPGHIYVAPGAKNMTIDKRDSHLFIKVRPSETEDIYKPNVNRTFQSVARTVGPGAVGVIMTGMGDDGARGLLEMKQSGAVTIAQSEDTCMVFGMPKKAIDAGAVDYIIPLDQIGRKVMELI